MDTRSEWYSGRVCDCADHLRLDRVECLPVSWSMAMGAGQATIDVDTSASGLRRASRCVVRSCWPRVRNSVRRALSVQIPPSDNLGCLREPSVADANAIGKDIEPPTFVWLSAFDATVCRSAPLLSSRSQRAAFGDPSVIEVDYLSGDVEVCVECTMVSLCWAATVAVSRSAMPTERCRPDPARAWCA